ncbi:MAG TPA: S9 family peptidase, partial [Vicinamibacteria bacterium]
MLAAPGIPAAEPSLPYPSIRKIDTVDDFHGTKVADPYRWLEDLSSPETASFIDTQNKLAFGYLEKIQSRAAIEKRLTELWNYPRTNVPNREAGQLFYRRNTGLQQQSPLFVRASLAAEPRLLLDPNTLSKDGSVALSQTAVSPDGKYLAYGLAPGGADWQTIHVREIATGRDLDDRVEWFRFSGISWTKDGKGFFYSRFPQPPKGQELSAELLNHRIYYHRVGTPQSEDRLVYERPDNPRWFLSAGVTEDGRYLIVYLRQGSDPRNRFYYADLGDPLKPRVDAPIVPIVDEFLARFDVLGNRGPVFIARTDLDAPRRRVIAIDPRLRTGRAGWKTLVPEAPHPLEEAAVAGGKIFAGYLVDVKSRIDVYTLDGAREGELALPGVGAASNFAGRE